MNLLISICLVDDKGKLFLCCAKYIKKQIYNEF